MANALGVTLAHLLRNYGQPQGEAQLVKKNEGMEVVPPGTKREHTYRLLATRTQLLVDLDNAPALGY